MYRNFEVWCRNRGSGTGWKHSIDPPPLEDYIFYLVIAKNPYLWIESLAFRGPADYIARQRKYPANDWNVPADLLAGGRKINVINCAKTWSEFYGNWVDVDRDDKVTIFSYESLLRPSTRGQVLNMIAQKHKCEWRKNPDQYHSSETHIIDRPLPTDKLEYYLASRPKHLTDKQVEAISKHLRDDLLTKFNYTKL